ncbi:MAG TPA: hypothetical protein VFW47_06495 [Phenylobacterium sp.]|nr:hypothetical protein [Phenylobacterium sp.]
MAFIRPWRDFKRMQDVAVCASGLIYAGAVVNAFAVLPGGTRLAVRYTLFWPAGFMFLSMALPLLIGPTRRLLARYVWLTFQAGFGQTAVSVLSGIGLLSGAALFIYWQVLEATHGGPYPAGVFSGYAAGIGILIAQAVLVRMLERTPEVRKLIEEA